MATAQDAIASAWQQIQAGRAQEAEQASRQILREAPSDPDAWYLLGVACQLQGKLDEAAASYERAWRFALTLPKRATTSALFTRLACSGTRRLPVICGR